MDHDIKLNNLKFTQLQQVYQEELRRYAGDGGGEKDKDKVVEDLLSNVK